MAGKGQTMQAQAGVPHGSKGRLPPRRLTPAWKNINSDRQEEQAASSSCREVGAGRGEEGPGQFKT